MGDFVQMHSSELKGLIKIVQTGKVTSPVGKFWYIDVEAKEDILWAIWRILGANPAAKNVFGEGNGFELPLAVLESMQTHDDHHSEVLLLGSDFSSSLSDRRNEEEGTVVATRTSVEMCMQLLDALLHVVTIGASENPINRNRLHQCISSQSFKHLVLNFSGLICAEFEEKITELLFDVALEHVHSPSQNTPALPALVEEQEEIVGGQGSSSFRIPGIDGKFSVNYADNNSSTPTREDEVFNPAAILLLFHCFILFSVKLQLRILFHVRILVRSSPRNQDALTAAGK